MTALSLSPPLGPPARVWARDFAVVGGLSALIAPAAVFSFGALAVPYFATSVTLGALTGALLGRMTHRWLRGRLRRWPKVAWLPVGAALGAAWGLAVGFPAGAGAGLFMGERGDFIWAMGVMSAVPAALVGAVQLGWFWLAYAYLRVRQRSVRWALALSLVAPLAVGGLFILTFLVRAMSARLASTW